MNSQEEIEDAAVAMIEKRGRTAMERAKQEILSTIYDDDIISEALKHYAQVSLPLVMPIFPALMLISCEMADGKFEKIDSIAAGLALIAFAGDIHDDIIDKSIKKYGKKTVFGAFGEDIAILAGDALMIQGSTIVQNNSDALTSEQRKSIFNAIKSTLFEISKAEAKEKTLSKSKRINPEEYFEVLRLKGSVAELQCRVGCILGKANSELTRCCGQFGRTIGMLGIIKDEFRDMFDYYELEHRIRYECPPLPMICALTNPLNKKEIKSILSKEFGRKEVIKISKIVMHSEEMRQAINNINLVITKEKENKIFLKETKETIDAMLLLDAMSEAT